MLPIKYGLTDFLMKVFIISLKKSPCPDMIDTPDLSEMKLSHEVLILIGKITFLSGFVDFMFQAWYFTEAMKVIASMPPGHCLGALAMLQWKLTISSSGEIALVSCPFKNKAYMPDVCCLCHDWLIYASM